MWKCSKCERSFKCKNQWHSCTSLDMGELFLGKPDDLVLAFDRILEEVMHWDPTEVGVAKHSIVFTSKKAWLVIKPMSKELDLKFYTKEVTESEYILRVVDYNNKYAHHIRVKNKKDITDGIITLLRMGFNYSLQ